MRRTLRHRRSASDQRQRAQAPEQPPSDQLLAARSRLQALAILAAVAASREKWDQVDKYVGKMSELSANSPEVLVAAAEIAATWGERKRAMNYLEQAEKLSPRHPLVVKLALGGTRGCPGDGPRELSWKRGNDWWSGSFACGVRQDCGWVRTAAFAEEGAVAA